LINTVLKSVLLREKEVVSEMMGRVTFIWSLYYFQMLYPYLDFVFGFHLDLDNVDFFTIANLISISNAGQFYFPEAVPNKPLDE